MADHNDDPVEIPDATDPASPADMFGAELWSETRKVCDRAHKLLGAEVAGGTGAAETERVCLDIPKGLVLIAQYIVAREHFSQTAEWMDDALDGKGAEGRAVRKVVHERLGKYLTDALHDELHWLATGGHRILRAEAERRGHKAGED